VMARSAVLAATVHALRDIEGAPETAALAAGWSSLGCSHPAGAVRLMLLAPCRRWAVLVVRVHARR